MNTILTILTIIFIPCYGIWMFKQGRKYQRELDGLDLTDLVNNIKAKEKFYETRDKENY